MDEEKLIATIPHGQYCYDCNGRCKFCTYKQLTEEDFKEYFSENDDYKKPITLEYCTYLQKYLSIQDSIKDCGINNDWYTEDTINEAKDTKAKFIVSEKTVQVTLNKEELRSLINDITAYTWQLEEKHLDTEEYGYYSRKFLLTKLKAIDHEEFPEDYVVDDFAEW